MSFATELAKDSLKYDVFATVSPRFKLGAGSGTDYPATNYSGNVWWVTFPYPALGFKQMFLGPSVSHTPLTRVDAIAEVVSGSEYYYDPDTAALYFYTALNLASTTITFNIDLNLFLSTRECLWYSTPTDSTSELAKWPANILSPPEITVSAEDISGIVNVDAGGIEVAFNREDWQALLGNKLVSFKNAPVTIWHVAGELDTANVERMFAGIVSGELICDVNSLKFELAQTLSVFDRKLETHTINVSDDAQDYDPNYDQTDIRVLLGYEIGSRSNSSRGAAIDTYAGILPINQTYKDVSPTTAHNRTWVLGWDHGGDCEVDLAAAGTNGGSTSKKIVSASDRAQFVLGEYVDVLNGVTHYYVTITNINTGTNELTFSGAVGLGNVTITKQWVEYVYLIQNGTRYDLTKSRDYSLSVSSNKILVTLTSGCEANVGASTINPANGDYLLVIPHYLRFPKAQIGGVDFPSDVLVTHAYYGVPALYRFLRNAVGLTEAEINTQSFEDAYALLPISGLPDYYPFPSGPTLPNIRDILGDWLATINCIAFFDQNGLFAIKYVGAVSTSTRTISDDEIFDGTLSFTFDYSENGMFEFQIYESQRALVSSYDAVNTASTATSFQELDDYSTPFPDYGESGLNRIEYPKQLDARPNLNGLYPYRYFIATFDTSVTVAADEIGSTITLSSKYLPGYDYDGAEHSVDLILIKIEKSVSGVRLTLRDPDNYYDGGYA